MTDVTTIAESPAMPTAPVRTGPKRFWTTREEKVLREHYPAGGIAACMPHLPGRTEGAVYQHAAVLGLKTAAANFKRERWATSEQIDAAIRRVYQGDARKNMVADLARACNRPRWWISRRASAMGLVAPRFKEPPWSEAEIELAVANAHKHPDTIVRILKRHGFARTPTAVTVKLKRQGATRQDPDHFTATGLSRLMGVDAKVVTGWISKGWLRAGHRGTDRTEVQGGDQWWIHRRDIRRFIGENAAAVDLRKVDKFWFIELLLGGVA